MRTAKHHALTFVAGLVAGGLSVPPILDASLPRVQYQAATVLRLTDPEMECLSKGAVALPSPWATLECVREADNFGTWHVHCRAQTLDGKGETSFAADEFACLEPAVGRIDGALSVWVSDFTCARERAGVDGWRTVCQLSHKGEAIRGRLPEGARVIGQ